MRSNRFFAALVAVTVLVAGLLNAQAPESRLAIYVDTAGVSAVAPDVFVTWVFAKASPDAPPSSGLIVAFDCQNNLVKRMAQVVYHLNADSTAVEGDVVEVNEPWSPMSIPDMMTLVCEIGATRPYEDEEEFPSVEEFPSLPHSPYRLS